MSRRFRILTKIQSKDEVFNRFQDQLLEVVNPVLRDLGTAPVVSGSRGGNVALGSLLTALAQIGLIEDKTT